MAGEVCAYDLNLGRFSCRPLDPEFDCPTCPDCDCVTDDDCPDCHVCNSGQCENECSEEGFCCDDTCVAGECCNRHDCNEDELCLQNVCYIDIEESLVCGNITAVDIENVVRECRNSGDCPTNLFVSFVSVDLTNASEGITKTVGVDQFAVNIDDVVCSGEGLSCCNYTACTDGSCAGQFCTTLRNTYVNFSITVDGSDSDFRILCPEIWWTGQSSTSCQNGNIDRWSADSMNVFPWFTEIITCSELKADRNLTNVSSSVGGCTRCNALSDNDNACTIQFVSF